MVQQLKSLAVLLIVLFTNIDIAFSQIQELESKPRPPISKSEPPQTKLKGIEIRTQDRLEKSLLWEISGNGLAQPSYLFGTIHIICEDDFFWHPYMQEAFDKTQELVLEIDMDDLEEEFGNTYGSMVVADEEEDEDFSASEYVNYDPPPPPIAKNDEEQSRNYVHNLDKEPEYSRIDSVMNIFEVLSDTKLFRQHNNNRKNMPKDSNIGKLLLEIPIINASQKGKLVDGLDLYSLYLGCDEVVSYEGKLSLIARAQNKEITGLETIEEQLEAFASYSTNSNVDEDDFSNYSADLELEIGKSLKKLVNAYKTQDIDLLLQYMNLAEMGGYNLDIMLFNRNKNWVKKLPAIMSASPKFIAVGAGHLSGSKGLIHLLKAQGYTLKPILK